MSGSDELPVNATICLPSGETSAINPYTMVCIPSSVENRILGVPCSKLVSFRTIGTEKKSRLAPTQVQETRAVR